MPGPDVVSKSPYAFWLRFGQIAFGGSPPSIYDGHYFNPDPRGSILPTGGQCPPGYVKPSGRVPRCFPILDATPPPTVPDVPSDPVVPQTPAVPPVAGPAAPTIPDNPGSPLPAEPVTERTSIFFAGGGSQNKKYPKRKKNQAGGLIPLGYPIFPATGGLPPTKVLDPVLRKQYETQLAKEYQRNRGAVPRGVKPTPMTPPKLGVTSKVGRAIRGLRSPPPPQTVYRALRGAATGLSVASRIFGPISMILSPSTIGDATLPGGVGLSGNQRRSSDPKDAVGHGAIGRRAPKVLSSKPNAKPAVHPGLPITTPVVVDIPTHGSVPIGASPSGSPVPRTAPSTPKPRPPTGRGISRPGIKPGSLKLPTLIDLLGLFGRPRGGSGVFNFISPLTPSRPTAVPSPAPAPSTPPIPSPLPIATTNPGGPLFPGTTSRKFCDCAPKKKSKPKKLRDVCFRGTYIEGARGLKKMRKEQVPCQ
jgi:hypothetical protein